MMRVLLISILFFISCANQISVNNKIITDADGTSMLYGKITQEILYSYDPDWKKNEDNYRPDDEIISSLSYNIFIKS